MPRRLQLALLATIMLGVYPSLAAALNFGSPEILTGGTVDVFRTPIGSTFIVTGHVQATGGYDISFSFIPLFLAGALLWSRLRGRRRTGFAGGTASGGA